MESAFTIFVWIAALAAAALLAWVAAVFASRAIKQSMSAEAADPFTLQDLREMLASGQITETEFDTMRGAILGSFAQTLDPARNKDIQSPASDLDDLLKWEERPDSE